MKRFVAGLLAGSAALALATGAQAGRADSSGTSQQGASNDAKIQQLEQDIQQLNAQHRIFHFKNFLMATPRKVWL